MRRRHSITTLFLILGLAAAARPAGALDCDPYPKVAWWGSLSHESVTKYVKNRHNGVWNDYVQKWQNQGDRLKQIFGKGSSVVIKSQGITLKGATLDSYIKKMEKRISVNKCLAAKSASAQQSQFASSLQESKPSAEQGNAESQFKLGNIYEKGRGVPKDSATAVKWYRKAALQGYAKSQYTLGKMYEYGLGVPKDYATAFSWIKKAAEAGHNKAQYSMGKYLRSGLGVNKDPAEGIRWWTKAAENGYAKAQGALGYRYEQGQGVPKDYAKAVKWYRMSADQGNAQANFMLGLLYESGQGVSKDPAKAARRFRIAAQQGLDIAKEALARVE